MLGILHLLIDAFCLILFVRILISWVAPESRHPVVEFIVKITEPVLAPIRDRVGILGGFDVSPIIVFFLLRLVQTFL